MIAEFLLRLLHFFLLAFGYFLLDDAREQKFAEAHLKALRRLVQHMQKNTNSSKSMVKSASLGISSQLGKEK